MNRNPKTMNQVLLAIVVLSIGLNDISTGAAAAAIASMIKEFPEVSVTSIQLLVTLPNIVVMFVAPMYGWLSTRFRQRKIIIFGVFCFVFFGALPAFLDSFLMIAISRALLGVGSGITIPAAISLVNSFYEGVKKDRLIGYNHAVGCLGGIVTQTLGGYLALINWRYTFLAYLFPIWVLILAILYLPETEKPVAPKKTTFSKSVIFQMPLRVYGLAFIYLLAASFRTMLPVNLSIVIETNGIGTSANSGIALSIFTVGALIGGLVFGKVKLLFRRYTIAFTWLAIGIGFALFSLSSSLLGIYLTTGLSGIGMGMMIPAYFSRVTEISEPQWVGFSISLIAAVQGLGNFINPIIAGQLISIFGKQPGYFPIIAASVFLIAFSTILVVVEFFSKQARERKIAVSS